MLKLAGCGVAMGNAVPITKSGAVGRACSAESWADKAQDFVTLTNDEGGVGAFLEKVFGLPTWTGEVENV